MNKNIQRKTWEEFQNTGLLLFINSILHAFGWAIVIEVDEDGHFSKCYPARTKFRGFDNQSVSESHKRIATYLLENSDDLYNDAHE